MAKKNQNLPELKDSGYFLKLVLYMVVGSLWLKVGDSFSWQIPIPVGLLIGLILSSYERHKLDRKIEYAILLIAAFVGFWAPVGIFVRV